MYKILIKRQFIRKNWYFLSFSLVLCIGIFLRAYNFINRIDYSSDSARDILIAQEALRIHKLPLFASFSSTGPYVFGPHFYWTNMLSYYIFPSHIAPFLLLFVFGVISIGGLMHAAKIIGGEKLSIISGLLIAFSPQFISRSISLTQHSYLGHLSVFSLLFFVLLIKQKQTRYAFLLGLFIGLATMFHYAGINLLLLSPFIFFIPNVSFKKKVAFQIMFFLGFFLMWTPLLYWDSHQQFANLRNFLDFIFIGQYRIYVPNSWRIFLFTFLPSYWANVAGGYKIVSYLIIISWVFMMIIAYLRKGLNRYTLFVFLSFFFLLLLNRYYKGERFDGYVIYMAPFIFIISAWTINELMNLSQSVIRVFEFTIKKTALLGVLLLVVVLSGSFNNAKQFIFFKNYHMEGIYNAEKLLISAYPNKSFLLYDYLYQSTDQSHVLSVILHNDGLSNKNGVPIGIVNGLLFNINKNLIIGKINYSTMIRLDSGEIDVNERDWKKKNQENVYEDSIGWSEHEKLKSTFNMLDYIKSRLKIN